jgi:ribonuclease VapC
VIVDTSALMAILLEEAEKPVFSRTLAKAAVCQLSGGSWIELAAVQTRGNRDFQLALDKLMREFRIGIAPVTGEQALIGHSAYRIYGQGSGHPARLNFGDCFAYALAKATGEPLLFKGDDFIHTDVEPAWVAEA